MIPFCSLYDLKYALQLSSSLNRFVNSNIFIFFCLCYYTVKVQKSFETEEYFHVSGMKCSVWGMKYLGSIADNHLHKYITFNKELGWIFRNPSLVMFSFLSRVALPIPFRLQRSVIHSKHSNYVYAWHELFCILNIEWKTKWLLLTSMAINLWGIWSPEVQEWSFLADTTDIQCQYRS